MTSIAEDVSLTRSEAAQALGLSVRQVDRLVSDGVLRAIRYANREVRITQESVLAELRNRPPVAGSAA